MKKSLTCIIDGKESIIDLGEDLGKGAFGVVKIATERTTGRKFAVKIQNKYNQIEYQKKTLKGEGEAESYVNRQLQIEDEILRFTGCFISSFNKNNSFDEEKHYSVMKYIDGKPIRSVFKDLSGDQRISCFRQLAEQVQFLHDNGYMHLDIWRDNILYSNRPHLHDYGSSAKMDSDGKFVCKLKGSQIAPEIIASTKNLKPCRYGTGVDVFALGMTFFELMYETYIDYEDIDSLQDFLIKYPIYYQKALDVLSENNDKISQLIVRMIDAEKDKRITLTELISELDCLYLMQNPVVNNPEIKTGKVTALELC